MNRHRPDLLLPLRDLLAENDAGGSIWPVYTHLVKGNRDLVLSVQSFELRLVVRKAMELVEERVRFQHAFPDFVLRYEILKERIRADLEYVAKISKKFVFYEGIQRYWLSTIHVCHTGLKKDVVNNSIGFSIIHAISILRVSTTPGCGFPIKQAV
ncbi:hypothetical protein JOM56_015518 [Amanita muscaria]